MLYVDDCSRLPCFNVKLFCFINSDSRITGFLKDLLSSNTPSECRIPAGFSAVSDELSHVSGRFLRLASHNRSVYGQVYASIIKDVIQKHSVDEASSGGSATSAASN